MPQMVLQNELQQQHKQCASVFDGNGETPDTPSGDGDFGLMKVQWSFVLHVGCAFWSISTKVELFYGLKDKHLNCATHATLIRCSSLTTVHDVA